MQKFVDIENRLHQIRNPAADGLVATKNVNTDKTVFLATSKLHTADVFFGMHTSIEDVQILCSNEETVIDNEHIAEMPDEDNHGQQELEKYIVTSEAVEVRNGNHGDTLSR